MILSASVPTVVYETSVRCAELLGYDTMSSFVRDAILDKMEQVGAAVGSIARQNKMNKPDDEFGLV